MAFGWEFTKHIKKIMMILKWQIEATKKMRKIRPRLALGSTDTANGLHVCIWHKHAYMCVWGVSNGTALTY